MKTSVLCWAAGFALLMGLGTETNAADPNAMSGTATVVRLHGKARVSADGKSWQTLKKNMTVPAGAVIQTADGSTLDLRVGPAGGSSSAELAEGTVRLQSDTVLAVEHIGEQSGQGAPQDVQLDLQAGGIVGRVGQMAVGSHYEVKFSKGIAGVRNGVFQISSTGEVSVPTGETVVVTVNNDGTAASTIVTGGKRFDAMTGSMTDMPRNSATERPTAPPPPATAPPSNTNPKAPGLGGSLRSF